MDDRLRLTADRVAVNVCSLGAYVRRKFGVDETVLTGDSGFALRSARLFRNA
jgi:hypothetical protein